MISWLIYEREIFGFHIGRTVSRLVDLFLLLFCHVLEASNYPVALWLAAEAGEGEADVPLSTDVIET